MEKCHESQGLRELNKRVVHGVLIGYNRGPRLQVANSCCCKISVLTLFL